MIKEKGKKIALVSLVAALVAAVAFSATFSFYQKGVARNGSYGEVSLRSYYDSGEGTKTNPFIITRPRHLYNLSRLQNLGIYGDPEKKIYFQLGKKGLGGPDQYGVYADDTSPDTQSYLDMSDSNFSYEPIWAIGSETMPFYGEFDGKGLEIRDLTVFADPQDAGLFGYTAHGSYVHDLFLSNVTIHTMGYTDTYRGLYGEGEDYTAGDGVYISYKKSDDSYIHVTTECEDADYIDYDATSYFADEADELTGYGPIITIGGSNANYDYKLLGSGDFVTKTGTNTFKVDVAAVGEWFKRRKNDAENPPSYPITYSSSVSLCATHTDEDGVDHSRVVASLRLVFTLVSGSDNYIHMIATKGEEHSNNIGLVIGHCDGSLKDCYVHNGEFYFNDGDRLHKSSGVYNPLDYHSSSGLIGLIGDTVHNAAADESGAGNSTGSSIGALDFTTIYDSIVADTSYTKGYGPVNAENLSLGYTYTPSLASEYLQYLRKDNTQKYVTKGANVVSFRGRQVIRNSDLGVFTVATDYYSTGYGGDASTRLDYSAIELEDVTYDTDDYYVYATTGEYVRHNNAESADIYNVSYSDYLRSLVSDHPTRIYPGYHFPSAGEVSSESFKQRELYQNYIVRFKLEPEYRTNAKTFYMSESDRTTAGGDFMAKYFRYKLVDEEGDPVEEGGENCGVMLRDYRFGHPREIEHFAASFATQDLSLPGQQIYCLYNEKEKHPAANTVNFEVVADEANVTVVAALADLAKPAVLGVYRYNYEPDNPTAHTYSGSFNETELSPYDGDGRPISITRKYNDPDYAFFMPTDSRLAYFDYTRGAIVDDTFITPEEAAAREIDSEEVKGYYGNYVYADSSYSFHPADESTEATLPSLLTPGNEFGYETGKTRLYLHTFKLPRGRYCLMSATGTETEIDSNKPFGTAKIFYVCAQGQDKGQFSLKNTAFDESVSKIDFITGVPTPENIADPSLWRCYVNLLKEEEKRSHFLATPLSARIKFEYVSEDGERFVISSPNGASSVVSYMAVDTYRHDQYPALSSLPLVIFGSSPSATRPQYYPTS